MARPAFDSPEDPSIYDKPPPAAPPYEPPYDPNTSDPRNPESLADAVVSNTEYAARNPTPEQIQRRRIEANLAALDDPKLANIEAAGKARSAFGESYSALTPRAVKVARPFYEETRAFNERAQGLNMQRREDQANVDDAVLREQVIAAKIAEAAAEEHRQAIMEARANEVESARRENEQIDRIRGARDAAAEAARAFAADHKIDPKRAIKNMGFGMKVVAVLGAIFSGANGDADPVSHINNLVERDLEAQRQNAMLAHTAVDNAHRNVGVEQEIYQRILARSASQREADDTYKLGRLQSIQLQASALLQGAGITILSATQKQFFTRLDEEINAIQLALGKQAAANTPTMMRRVGPTGAQARLLEKRAGKAIDAEFAAGPAIADVALEREKMRSTEGIAGAGRAEQAAARAAEAEARRVEGPHGVLAQAAALSAKAGGAFTVTRLIDNFLAKHEGKNIPGITPFAGGWGTGSEAGMNPTLFGTGPEDETHADLRILKQEMGRAWSQGAVTTDELKEFQEMIGSGLYTGGDDTLRQNLAAIRAGFAAKVEGASRGYSREAREMFFNNPEIADPASMPAIGGDTTMRSFTPDR